MFGLNKKLVISVALCLLLFTGGLLAFVIIPNEITKFRPVSGAGPENTASVSGNGGNAVMVGEYLYFTSGYISLNSIKYKQNEYNNVKGEGAIYRVKMSGGLPEYDNGYLSDLGLQDWDEYKDKDRFHPEQKPEYAAAMDLRIKKGDLKLIVPKVAGWENSALWVFGNTLIYTSPNNTKNKYGKLQRNKIDFFAVNLNGDNNRKIYTTRTESVTLSDFTAVNVSGKTYLLCHDGESLVRVSMNGTVSTVSTKADSFAFPRVTSYYSGYDYSIEGDKILTDDTANLAKSYAGMMEYVFYTEKRETDTKSINYSYMRGNILVRYNIASGKKEVLRHDHNTHKILALGNGTLIFETTFETVDDTAGGKALYIIGNKIQDGKIVPKADKTADKNDFDLSNLNLNFLAQPLQPEETLYISGERTNIGEFSYVTHADSRLFVNGLEIPVYDVAEVIEIAAGSILYKTDSGSLACIDYSGGTKYTANLTADEAAGTRITAFQVLNNRGQVNGGFMFFYIKTVSEVGDGGDTVTVGAIVDSLALEYLLVRLDEKFIAFPEENA
jgi:hypothetical protein